jgi:putative ABC transport system permease protein
VIGIWLGGLGRRRWGRLGAAALGVAVAVALLASLGAFLASSRGSMTQRAISDVSVDWQVAVQPGVDPGQIENLVRGTPGVRTAVPVGFAQTAGMSASTDSGQGATTQHTGPGMALGLPPGYRVDFPGQIRTLNGADTGVLLAQQSAANLHAKPGDTVTVERAGLPPAQLRIDGVVDLPQANSLFQTVGAPPSAQPIAPPDNVILLPDTQWHAVFDPLGAARPDLVTTQIHTARVPDLPPDPAQAYTVVTAAAHNLEAASTGGALVGDNLAAALDAARSDAAYAQVLFLFLGLPGAVLAAMLTAAIVGAGAERRRRDQALARIRGASTRRLLQLACAEAVAVGASGAAIGLGAAALIGRAAFGAVRFGTTATAATSWALGAAAAGLVIAGAAVVLPAWRDLRGATVASSRSGAYQSDSARRPWWIRYGIDVALFATGGLVVWASSRNGYRLVLAPEGVSTISVSYWAFAGPALLGTGGALLVWRASDALLRRGRLLGRMLRPVAGPLSTTAAAMMARRRRELSRSIVLLTVALAFAASTAIFNATYQAQAEVDARLTNGADVTVTEPPASGVGPAGAIPLAAVPGVRAVEPLQHRFAYIGADLQDLYGVQPSTITNVTGLSDGFFQGGTARELMDTLAARPDSILVSAETVTDYQLRTGDPVNLRLLDTTTQQLITVPFHYAGIATEFPTAPKDSFFVANASYVAQRTGSAAVGAFLIDTGGHNVTDVAQQLRGFLGTSATVTDITHTRSTIGSSLTSVDLATLTRVELAFALLLAAASGGLVLALGLAERRRTFAITTALGASRAQLRSLVNAETATVVAGGLIGGVAVGWLLSEVLVAVLTGVFDPPPDALAVPWGYLSAATAATLVALGLATGFSVRRAHRPPTTVLREL